MDEDDDEYDWTHKREKEKERQRGTKREGERESEWVRWGEKHNIENANNQAIEITSNLINSFMNFWSQCARMCITGEFYKISFSTEEW